MLRDAYTNDDDREYVSFDGEFVPNRDIISGADRDAARHCMLLHDRPPKSLTAELPPPLQQIMDDGTRLRARLPAYLTQRRALLDAHCPLLLPLRDLVAEL
jgi:hypothetical protein